MTFSFRSVVALAPFGIVAAACSGMGGANGTVDASLPDAGGLGGSGGSAGTANGLGGSAGTGGSGGTAGAAGAGGSGGAAGAADSGGSADGGGSPDSGGSADAGGSADSGSSPDAGNSMAPGDIATAAGTPLVAAHSMTRALYAAYNGNLFQVRRASDATTQNITPTSAGGYVNINLLTTFCSGTTCAVSILYDQSGNANDLPQTTPANQPSVEYWSTSNGIQVPMAVTVHEQWLRNRVNTHKIPTGAASQTEYMVVHGAYFNNACCYDYGNMESTVGDDGAGTMNALYFGSDTDWTRGAGNGPWAMSDLENGLFSGDYADPNAGASSANPNDPTIAYSGNNIVTVLSKTNGTTAWVLKAGDAVTGPLNTYWNGALPNGYNPLRQQGGLSLGEGGDGSNSGTGAFSEGVVIAAMTSDATDNLIQANLNVAYGR
jgi:hypothetical protein